MAEPVLHKLEIEYINPSDIESEVPGAQKLREHDPIAAMQESVLDDDIKAETPEDYVLAPVMTVTKEEATFTKGDLKLQKVSVTENISNDMNGDHCGISNDDNALRRTTNDRRQSHDDGKGRTRIPTLKFRQAVEKVKANRRDSRDQKDEIVPSPHKRSSIPRLKILTPAEKHTETHTDSHELDDEFDKIYDEVLDTEPKEEVIENITSVKIEDPVKLENKFEEIIHDYEDNKVQPISIEKIKQSRIPQLPKRVDQSKVPKPGRIPVSKANERLKRDEVKIEKVESKIPVQRIPHKVVKNEIKSEKIDTKIPMYRDLSHKQARPRYNSKDDVHETPVSIPVNENLLLEDQKNYNGISKPIDQPKYTLDPVKVAKREDIEKITRENYEKHPTNGLLKQEIVVEVPLVMEVNSIIDIQPESVSVDNNEIIEYHAVKTTDYDNELNKVVDGPEVSLKNNNNLDVTSQMGIENDDSYSPGKVSRILNRIRSYDVQNENIGRKSAVNVPKRSVSSKIAMFERHEPVAPPESRPRFNRVSSIKILKEVDPTLDNVICTKPIIVDEILKAPIHANLDSNTTKENADNKLQHSDDILQKDYKVDIVDGAVKYQEIEIIDVNESQPIIEYNIGEVAVIDDSVIPTNTIESISKSKEDEVNVTLEPLNPVEYEPTRIENTVEILEPIQTKYLEVKQINTDENSSNELLIDSIEYESNEYAHKAQIANSDDDAVFSHKYEDTEEPERRRRKSYKNTEDYRIERPKSVAEIDLGETVRGKVHEMITRMNSYENLEVVKKEKEIEVKERPRKKSVSKMIALFEQKSTTVKQIDYEMTSVRAITKQSVGPPSTIVLSDEEYDQRIAELTNAKLQYGRLSNMTYMVLRNGVEMPVLALGTALLDHCLIHHIIGAAIDLGYRAIDSAYIYGNEREVGLAIKAKIEDGTVTREDLFISSKLWSTFHRPDLVEASCRASLTAMELDYFDAYLIHNPMSFKEGKIPIPKIANVIQYSEYEYMDAWYGMEELVNKGLVKSIGVSNFNSKQLQRILSKARVKPVINQVECHPYLSQQRMNEFCETQDVKLSCFGVLGSKGTPANMKSGLPPVIDDPLVKVMAAGLNITEAQLLVRYQIELGHSVVVKASTGAHLWDNLQALEISLTPSQVEALHALNRNKRTFTFYGMGETHKNYPFNIPF